MIFLVAVYQCSWLQWWNWIISAVLWLFIRVSENFKKVIVSKSRATFDLFRFTFSDKQMFIINHQSPTLLGQSRESRLWDWSVEHRNCALFSSLFRVRSSILGLNCSQQFTSHLKPFTMFRPCFPPFHLITDEVIHYSTLVRGNEAVWKTHWRV